MKSENLFSIIDFLYYGMANVFQENLDSFLSIAEELELKGLMGQDNDTREKKPDEIGSQPNNSRKNGAPEQSGQLNPKCEHLEGISLPCNTCGNMFRSRSQLRKHRCL